jgi:hypothetical protein
MSEIAKNVRIVGFRIASVPKDTKLPNLGLREVEMVDLTTVGNAKYTVIPMRIHDAMRDTTGLWDIIEPHYSAWKKGFEIPTTGTPLTSWQGISREQIEQIAKTKQPDLTAADMDAAVRTIAGSARSMGIIVEGV